MAHFYNLGNMTQRIAVWSEVTQLRWGMSTTWSLQLQSLCFSLLVLFAIRMRYAKCFSALTFQ
jgi:hypothetical protein